jgi:hypothetical protein
LAQSLLADERDFYLPIGALAAASLANDCDHGDQQIYDDTKGILIFLDLSSK